jgi:hypothetical protein
MGFGVLFFAPPSFFGAEVPTPRLARCDRSEATTTLTLGYQLPGSAKMKDRMNARPWRESDENQDKAGPSKRIDEMGTETTTSTEFGETEVTFTIKQVPGPDRQNPYQVIIHAPFGQNLSGTIEGTKYEIAWNSMSSAENHSPPAEAEKAPARGDTTEPMVSTVPLSPSELMMLPHDARLAFDIQHASESGSGDWIRLQATDPTGSVALNLRIQTVEDPNGKLGMADVAETEVNTVCAPYLSNSLEKSCKVQILKRPSGDIYYCLLSNAAFANYSTPPAAQFRFLFMGVFRIGSSAAFVVGNLSQKDDVNYRLMIDTLERISTLPIVEKTEPPLAPVTGVTPQ